MAVYAACNWHCMMHRKHTIFAVVGIFIHPLTVYIQILDNALHCFLARRTLATSTHERRPFFRAGRHLLRVVIVADLLFGVMEVFLLLCPERRCVDVVVFF